MRAFNLASSVPWAILTEDLELILDIAQRDHTADFEAVAAKQARRLDERGVLEMRGSTAVVNINGPIFRYSNLFTDISGATSIDSLAVAFEKARSMPEAKSIVLNIDSPGGEVSGTGEFAAQILAARGEKPIIAYVGELAASGAYWIAAAADEIVVFESARVGSIGVVSTYVGRDKANARSGVKEYEFVSSNAPYKRPDLETDEGRATVQAVVNDIETEMIAAIAAERNVSVEKVMADFGRGATMISRRAITAGMADRLGTFEALLAELDEQTSFGGSAVRNPQQGVVNMSTQTAEPKPAISRSMVIAEERKRIGAILACEEAVGRSGLAQTLALETDSTPEVARKLLASSPKAEAVKPSGFHAHMATVANPLVKPDAPEAEDDEAAEIAASVALYQGRNGRK